MITKVILSPAEVYTIVADNKYPVNESTKFLSRCIDGRYENSPSLPALAIPGADMGELALLYSTADQYGFEIDHAKAFATLQELLGKDNFTWHTDTHGDATMLGAGCGHLKQLHLDPAAYSLKEEDIALLDTQLKKAHQDGGKEVTLKGDHHEGAVVLIKGNYGILPQYFLETDSRKIQTQLFIFHQSLVDERHRAWVKKLIENKAITFFDNLDEEYLYEVLSGTTDEHLFETARRLATGLPIFQVTFAADGTFKIEQQGVV